MARNVIALVAWSYANYKQTDFADDPPNMRNIIPEDSTLNY